MIQGIVLIFNMGVTKKDFDITISIHPQLNSLYIEALKLGLCILH
ncbi:hypothetical protein [Fischerella muscicola]